MANSLKSATFLMESRIADAARGNANALFKHRRFVPGNAGTLFVAGNVTGSQVDLNVIPTGLIDRIESA